VTRLVQKTQALKIGPGDSPDAYLGPLISAQARDRVLRYIELAQDEGATLLCGGAAPTDAALARGFYVQPTVFGNAQREMRIAQEEVFGPVLSILRAESLDDALDKLNDVEYGLSASLFTRSLDAALIFAERAQAGLVRVNGETAGVEPQAPFGGMKASSSFSREQGLAAREFFTQIKTISIDRAG
jgi:aldehyde dehydrogenase (NAD+)